MKTAQHKVSPPNVQPVNKQVSSPNRWRLPSLSRVRLWSVSSLVLKTLASFPYLSPRLSSLSSRLRCSKLGTGPVLFERLSPASPPLCPLPLLSRRIRTRPSRTALSSEANTNQPQMFTLGEKEQQMQSHSIKLASLPLSLCLPLFPTLFFSPFLQVCRRKKTNPGEIFRSVGVTTFSLRLCLIFQLLLHSESPGFPLNKRK